MNAVLAARKIGLLVLHLIPGFALGRDDIVKFWFGEGDQPTPSFIREAAKAALDAGDTFYNHNLGLIELREALARYLNTLHAPRTRIDVERIAVTSAGINALSLIAQARDALGAVAFGMAALALVLHFDIGS